MKQFWKYQKNLNKERNSLKKNNKMIYIMKNMTRSFREMHKVKNSNANNYDSYRSKVSNKFYSDSYLSYDSE